VAHGIPHAPEIVVEALTALEGGKTVGQVARGLGLSRGTVTNWQRGQIPLSVGRRLRGEAIESCASCGAETHTVPPRGAASYAYLLGVYLGDGCVTVGPRSVALRIVLDAAYPAIIAEVRSVIPRVLVGKSTHARRPAGENYVVITVYSRAWLCLFPQHGPGRKHERSIRLAPWQEAVVGDHAGPFVRGLIHTDGWRGLNRVRVKGRDYAYPRYQFSSRSDDIRALFTGACDRLGVAWRPWGRYHVSVARRDAVARLDAHVGTKS
jgi:hypothetical protein